MSTRELCIMACVFCRDKQFQAWANDQIAKQQLVIHGAYVPGRNESAAKAFILHVCEARSRNDLDTDPDAGQRFHELVRKPFLEWKEKA